MQKFSASPFEMLRSLSRHRELIQALVLREVTGRYRGSSFGLLWSFFNPVFMLVVYTFVFSVVFKARWNVSSDSKTEFALVLFAGLMLFNFFAECVNKAPSLILSNANYVKKVIFPLEILPVVNLFAALFHLIVSFIVWVAAYIVLFGVPHLTVLFFPLILVPLLLMTVGISWFLASLGVYVRDVAQFIGIFTSVLMFLSPIFYPLSALPEKYQHLLYFNPLTLFVEQVRTVLYWGHSFDVVAYAVGLLFGSLVALAGFAFFQKTRKGFCDVL